MSVLISICCITYNQEPYITQCLEGFMAQKTDFDFEVLIHDDASSDNTSKIIRDFEKRYPTKIKPIYQIENQYSHGVRGINPRFNFARAKGKYIALCEGDDYWTDENKLQKQVDFLEQNKEYSLVCHDYGICKMEDGKLKEEANLEVEKEKDRYVNDYKIDLSNWSNPYLLKTCTVMFRRELFDVSIAKKYKHFKDGFLWVALLNHFPGKYLNEKMAVYRVSESGIWSMQSELNREAANARTGFEMNQYFKGKNTFIYSFARTCILKTLALLNQEGGEKNKKMIREFETKYLITTFKNNSWYYNLAHLKKIIMLYLV